MVRIWIIGIAWRSRSPCRPQPISGLYRRYWSACTLFAIRTTSPRVSSLDLLSEGFNQGSMRYGGAITRNGGGGSGGSAYESERAFRLSISGDADRVWLLFTLQSSREMISGQREGRLWAFPAVT